MAPRIASKLSNRKFIVAWQVLFLVLGTTWLLAPHLNPSLSYRTSLISQYEVPSQTYSWLFRLGDFLAGVLLLIVALKIKLIKDHRIGWLLAAISVGMITDPVFSTSCHVVGDICREYVSPQFVLHAIESTFTGLAFFAIAVYDARKRHKLVSVGFAIFQFGYGLLFVSQLANNDSFNTISQYIYQTSLIIWSAWYGRDLLAESNFKTSVREKRLVKNLVAVWAFINGVLAIVLSLTHIDLLGRINGLYFSRDTAWLAQHGIIVGVIMLYLSRHLARGEARARQIFLLLTGIETLKYAIISPHVGLMIFYLLTFVGLFVLRDDFDRGTVPATRVVKLQDLYFLIGGLAVSTIVGFVALDRDSRVSRIASQAIDNFGDYLATSHRVPHGHLESALLAHTISTFIAASLAAILWILFRPSKPIAEPREAGRVAKILQIYSRSSEDYFKLWPNDKDYFWDHSRSTFLAYRMAGPVAFGLADPVGSDPHKLLDDFNDRCRQHRLKTCYLPVYEQSVDMYKKSGLDTLQIGSSAIINIKHFIGETGRGKWWRWRLNKATKSGYIFHESVPPHSQKLLSELQAISGEWLKAGGHQEQAFALGYFDIGYLQQCRVFYLADEVGRTIAFANQLPGFGHQDVMTVDMIRYLPGSDPMAYLLYKIIEAGQDEYKYFDLGFVPFAKATGPLLAVARAISSGRFSARGLEQFKGKFDPDWRPNYLAYDGDIADLALIAANLERVMSVGQP